MKILYREFTVDGVNGEWRCDIYGDTHYGTKSVDEQLVQKHLHETKDSGKWWCHVGDAIDGITNGDRRFNDGYKQNLADWAWLAHRDSRLIEAEWMQFHDHFSPVKDQGLFVLSGDGKHNQMADVSDVFGATLQDMNLPGGYPAVILVAIFRRGNSTEKKAVPLVFHHGWFAGRTTSNKVINLERALNVYPQAWGFFCGHGHHKTSSRVDSLAVEGKRLIQRIRRAAMTGSYLKTYCEDTVGYGEVKGYPPVALGKITLVLRPFCLDSEKRIELENM